MKSPFRKVTLVNQASRAAREGDYLAAAECHKEILRLDEGKKRSPNDFEMSVVARYLASAGKDEEALEFAQRALQLNPGLTLALEAAAIAHARRGEHGPGKEYTLRRLRQKPFAGRWLWTAFCHLLSALSSLCWWRRRATRDELRLDALQEWATCALEESPGR
jgi:tetratricopeptide (TPR) repeat protein